MKYSPLISQGSMKGTKQNHLIFEDWMKDSMKITERNFSRF